MKIIFRLIGYLLLMAAVFSCANSNTGSIESNNGARGLAVVEETDIAVFLQGSHTNDIRCIAYSPDGKFIASGSSDNTIRIWDIASGREFGTLIGHSGGISAIIYSTDGKNIISGSGDRTIKLWNAISCEEIKTFSGHTGSVNSLAYNHKKNYIVSGSSDRTVKIWDVNDGNVIRTLSGFFPDGIDTVAFSPDGKSVAFKMSSGQGNIKIWDIASNSEIITFAGNFSSMIFSPDWKSIINLNGNIFKLFEVKNGREIKTFSGHTNPVNSVVYSPDGKYLASSSSDGTIKLWNAASGKEIRTFTGHTGMVFSADYSPDGKYIVSSSLDRTIKLWDAASGRNIRSFDSFPNIKFSPDSKSIAGFSGNTLNLVEITTGSKINFSSNKPSLNLGSAHSLDGKKAAYSAGKNVCLWDIAAGKIIMSIDHGEVYTTAFSPDGKYVATGSADQTVKIWDVETGREIRTLSDFPFSVTYITYSPNGQHIYVVSGFGTKVIKLFEAATGREIRTIQSAYSDHYDVAIALSPDGKNIALGFCREVCLTDTATSEDMPLRIDRFTNTNSIVLRVSSDNSAGGGNYTFDVSSVAYSPDGKHVISGIFGGRIRIWDVNSRSIIRELKGHRGKVTSVAYSPDGKYIVSGGEDNKIIVWDANNGSEIYNLIGHSGVINSVMFSPGGEQIVSSSKDSTTRLWDVSTGTEIAQFISFSGSDSQLAAASRGLSVETGTASSAIDGEWLSITPDGYYQASPRGDRFLNVRVNNTVSGIDSYRSIFYNPDVVQARLQGKPDPASKANVTIQQVASFMPPAVTIHSPATFTTSNTATANLSVTVTMCANLKKKSML